MQELGTLAFFRPANSCLRNRHFASRARTSRVFRNKRNESLYRFSLIKRMILTGTDLMGLDGGVPNGDPGLLFSLLVSKNKDSKSLENVFCEFGSVNT